MKTTHLSQTTCRPAQDCILFAFLCFLAIHLPMPLLGQSVYSTPYTFTTLAGNAGSGFVDGTGTTARFNFYYRGGVALDSAGNLFVADSENSTIRKMTPAGVVTTLAGLAGSFGSADGTGSTAQFYDPHGVTLDSAVNLYVADSENSTIRKVTLAGVVTTLAGLAGGRGTADGTGGVARFDNPLGLAVDSAGNVFVADTYNSTIRKVTPAGVVTTLAGLAGSAGSADGTGSAAQFHYPYGVAVDSAGNVYVADTYNSTIRKVTPGGVVTTLAGLAGNAGFADGTGSAAQFNQPKGVAVDSSGNVYVSDQGNHAIRKVTPAGVVTTLAETDSPGGLGVDSAGNIYVADTMDVTILKVTPAGVVTSLAGLTYIQGSADGTGSAARFSFYEGIGSVAVDGAGNVYVADSGNNTIRKVTPAGVVTTLAGLARAHDSADGTGSAARFNFDGDGGLAADSAGNVYVADTFNSTIRKGFPASSVPAPILYSPSLSVGQFGAGITGIQNLAVDIQSSSDLSNWQVVGTYILNGGTNYFVSPTPPQGTQFYRVHVR